MGKRIKAKKYIIILLVVIALVWTIIFPLQRFMAIKKFEDYISKQGIDSNRICEKEVIYNVKDGGYDIRVKYNDDEFMTYTYHYNYWTDRREEGLILDRMKLNVSGGNPSISDTVCKYPAIDY